MKLPRWVMVSMFTASTLATITAAAWWWITWPAATARSFAYLTEAANIRDARKLCGKFKVEACTVCHRVDVKALPATDPALDPGNSLTLLCQLQRVNQSPVEAQRRTLADLLIGRQWFDVSGAQVLVVRGSIAQMDCQFRSQLDAARR